MKRPTRLEILEYALEGLHTLIGTGDPRDVEYMETLEKDQQWIEAEVARVTAEKT